MHLLPQQVRIVSSLAEGEITGETSIERLILNPSSACFNTWSLPTLGAWDWTLNPFREVTKSIMHWWSLTKTLVHKQRANHLCLIRNYVLLPAASRQPLLALILDGAIELCQEKPGYLGDHSQTTLAELTRCILPKYISLLDTVSHFPSAWAEHKDTNENNYQSS